VAMSDTQCQRDVSFITTDRKQKNSKYHQQNVKWLSDLGLLKSKYWLQLNI